jgi:hypothetical protein
MDVLRAYADLVVDMLHLDGSSVRARMSEPLVVGVGELAVVAFDDMTDLWVRDP